MQIRVCICLISVCFFFFIQFRLDMTHMGNLRYLSICAQYQFANAAVSFRPNRSTAKILWANWEIETKMCGSVDFQIQFHFIHFSCSQVIQSTHTHKHTRTHFLSIYRKAETDKLFHFWCGINFLDVMAFLLSPSESGSQHFNANPINCCYEIEKTKQKRNKKIIGFH